MVKQYYFKTGVTIITEIEETKNGDLFWINPVEVIFMTQATVLRPLFSTTKDQKFAPNLSVLENDTLIQGEVSERLEIDYKKNVNEVLEKMKAVEEEIKLKESGLKLPPDMQRIIRGNFRLQGPK